ncbi:Mitochondria fission 1 protein [Elsinoe australis]|uniref:RING-type E3 ubiquitin transferase n=1 Tax=Elsinoe australis TaxID=40998 RepID=A0A2P7ZY63_9PEZI|nr:Mitochondria fission 1 protein [Elsinoe australis]
MPLTEAQQLAVRNSGYGDMILVKDVDTPQVVVVIWPRPEDARNESNDHLVVASVNWKRKGDSHLGYVIDGNKCEAHGNAHFWSQLSTIVSTADTLRTIDDSAEGELFSGVTVRNLETICNEAAVLLLNPSSQEVRNTLFDGECPVEDCVNGFLYFDRISMYFSSEKVEEIEFQEPNYVKVVNQNVCSTCTGSAVSNKYANFLDDWVCGEGRSAERLWRYVLRINVALVEAGHPKPPFDPRAWGFGEDFLTLVGPDRGWTDDWDHQPPTSEMDSDEAEDDGDSENHVDEDEDDINDESMDEQDDDEEDSEYEDINDFPLETAVLQETVDALPSGPAGKGGRSCLVCVMEIKAEDIAATLPCRHAFHKDCLAPWLLHAGTCPACRRALPKKVEPCDIAQPTDQVQRTDQGLERAEQEDTVEGV